MRCPICGSRTKVFNVREKKNKVHRRRECPDCLTRFTTEEKLVIDSLDEYLIRRLNRNFRTL
jgi:transcriptional regulator NrdR family protein